MMATTTKKKYPSITRWTLPITWLIVLVGTGLYLTTHLIHYVINWTRYYDNPNYHVWADKMMKIGTFQIRGSETALHSSVLIGLMVFGALVSIAMFIFTWRNYTTRTWMPIVAFIGFIVPLLTPAGNNPIGGIIAGYLVALIGSLLSAMALKNRL